MPIVSSTDDVQLAVHDLGGDGPDLLLSHATGFHSMVWLPVAARFTERYHAIAFDHRAHGDATAPANGDFRWEGYGEDVTAVATALGLDHAYGVGHSMGGVSLLMAELARPGTFRALALYEPILFPPDRPPFEGGNPLAAPTRKRRPEFSSRDEAYTNFAAKPPMSALTPEALRAYVDHGFADTDHDTVRLKCEPEHEARTYEQGENHRVYERLGDITCPVLIMAGVVEENRPSHYAEQVASQFRRGEFRVFDDLGHFGPLEDPGEVADAVIEFFVRTDG